MQQPPPAIPGMREDEVDTPALLIDLDAFEHNLDLMAKIAREGGIKLRPHAKTHKSPVIAHQQIARGAVGQCVQKVSEAEILAWGGVANILVSNQVVGASKLARFAALSRIADMAICADHIVQIEAIEAAAEAANTRLRLLLEIDVGMERCGVTPGPEAVALCQRIAGSNHLIFGGLQAYHGRAQHKRSFAERQTAITRAAELTAQTIDGLRKVGLDCAIVGGGGTGSYEFEIASGVYTELQAGSYCFMDADYGRNLDRSGAPISSFRQSLFVLATVMSRPSRNMAVIDAGLKAFAVDSGLPLAWQRPDIQFISAADEHGKLDLSSETTAPLLGEKLRFVPGHCDPTVDRYDWYVGIRNGRVECLWPVAARGAAT